MKNLNGFYTVSMIIVLMAIVGTTKAQVGGEWSLGPRFGGSFGIKPEKTQCIKQRSF